ncbi:DUF3016 domain-containing protein [Dokdonella sp. MW10]|uniref:DUF3016 domain-containing protein n=1 Tax=Dokdonella sp. MW10 TaxID=2992926 RepID=UPI003F7FB5C5
MNRIVPFTLASVLAAGLAAGAPAARAAAPQPADGARVHVDWTDPAAFTEVRDSHGRGMLRATDWLGRLQKHVVMRADAMLPPGQRLDVTFTDVKLAGAFEPWRGPAMDDVRIVKDIYPPRITLRFTLRGADGSIIEEGERTLRDAAFLSRGIASTSDTLRYEKRLLDDWLRREFKAA